MKNIERMEKGKKRRHGAKITDKYHCSGNNYRYRSEIKSKTFGL